MASSLAAAIHEKFGVTPKLVDGHNGIYEVTANGKVLYTNHGKCGQLPTNEQILIEFRKYKDPLPGKTIETKEIFPMHKGEG